MRNIYVLDTNVLLHDPNAFNHFVGNDVVIPLKVLEEIDQFKKELSERGRNARQVSRSLDSIRRQGSLRDGVSLDHDIQLRVAYPVEEELFSSKMKADDVIIKSAMKIRDLEPDKSCILISKDINLRLKADAVGVAAEDYENGHFDSSELYSGYREIEVSTEILETFREQRKVKVPFDDLGANEYVVMNEESGEQIELGRYDADHQRVEALVSVPQDKNFLRPRNREQQFAMDALLNDSIKLVTLIGKAGTGKTLLAVAAGVHKTLDEKFYSKMLVSRPTFPMGKDLGYLPGDVGEKLNPWMQPIRDALDLIKHGRTGDMRKSKDPLTSTGQIDIEPLTYIRGRSIPNQFIIIDEAQNLTPLEVKTVITRVGHGTKIVLTGDIYQIDNPYVDVLSNGLNAVADRFKEYPIAAHMLLQDGVRSTVAELASNVL